MTKRKAIMYLIIFAVLVTAAQTWKTNYLSDPRIKIAGSLQNGYF